VNSDTPSDTVLDHPAQVLASSGGGIWTSLTRFAPGTVAMVYQRLVAEPFANADLSFLRFVSE
jgi:hypothetical protein